MSHRTPDTVPKTICTHKYLVPKQKWKYKTVHLLAIKVDITAHSFECIVWKQLLEINLIEFQISE